MVIKSKYTGLILLVLTICLSGIIICYNLSRSDYPCVNATIIEVNEDKCDVRTSEVNTTLCWSTNTEGKQQPESCTFPRQTSIMSAM